MVNSDLNLVKANYKITFLLITSKVKPYKRKGNAHSLINLRKAVFYSNVKARRCRR